jgi:lysophospholipase L1-like esterase
MGEETMEQQQLTVYLAGDSTVADYPPESLPMLGWGAKLGEFLSGPVRVVNAATNGRSSKSFIDEGRLAAVLETMGAGDVFLIQFGHNDSKEDAERRTEPWSTYQEHLQQYIDGARSRGAVPVLVSSVCRRRFDDSGRLVDTHEDYPEAMRDLANRERVPYIDLCAKSGVLLRQLGSEKSVELFTWLAPGEHPNYPEGSSDNTHLNEHGAEVIARLVAEELAVLDMPLRDRIVLA